MSTLMMRPARSGLMKTLTQIIDTAGICVAYVFVDTLAGFRLPCRGCVTKTDPLIRLSVDATGQ